MPDTEMWRKLDELGKSLGDTRERIVRIEAGAQHRDDKLDAIQTTMEKRFETIEAEFSAFASQLARLAKLADDAQTVGRLAGIFTKVSWSAAAALAWALVTYWPTIKRWLP